VLLLTHKSLKGDIFDLPHAIKYVSLLFHSTEWRFANISAQIPVKNPVGEDFFGSVSPSKVYTMKWILHNWLDKDGRRILRNIEKAIVRREKSILIILEEILGTTRSARLSRYGDMKIVVAAIGVERTSDEWIALADSAGWATTKIYPLRNA